MDKPTESNRRSLLDLVKGTYKPKPLYSEIPGRGHFRQSAAAKMLRESAAYPGTETIYHNELF